MVIFLCANDKKAGIKYFIKTKMCSWIHVKIINMFMSWNNVLVFTFGFFEGKKFQALLQELFGFFFVSFGFWSPSYFETFFCFVFVAFHFVTLIAHKLLFPRASSRVWANWRVNICDGNRKPFLFTYLHFKEKHGKKSTE